jgi:phospholipid-translocating ATPase
MSESDSRVIQPFESAHFKYCNNAVKTTKYNLLTFLPLSLLIQFKKIANVYFLIISILTAQTFSPKNPYTMALTFGFVLVCSMLKELYEDITRYKQDKEINSQIVEVYDLVQKKVIKTRSQNLKVGDIIRVSDNEPFPADLLFLYSSKNRGIAYINTMNLDGETNLREKRAYEITQESSFYTEISEFDTQVDSSSLRVFEFIERWPKLQVVCDGPNKSLVKWNCRVETNSTTSARSAISDEMISTSHKVLNKQHSSRSYLEASSNPKLQSSSSPEDPQDISLSLKESALRTKSKSYDQHDLIPKENIQWDFLTVDQLLLKGCILKSTEYIFGQVVYTGKDTKIVLNSNTKVLNKTSKVQKKMNIILFSVFAFLILICIIYSSVAYDWRSREAVDHEYLDIDEPESADFGKQFGTFIVAYSHLIPISLYVALEILKLYLAYALRKDKMLYYEKDGKFAKCRSSDLIEELAGTEIIFTDKTGTLTCNEMKFVKCFIGGKVYYKDNPKNISEENSNNSIRVLKPELIESNQTVMEFFELLAVCHSVFVSDDTNEPKETVERDLNGENELVSIHEISQKISPSSPKRRGSDILNKIKYSATSPDELALVKASRDMNIIFVDRLQNTIKLHKKVESDYEQSSVKWLVELPFSSERARMSIIIQKDDEYYIYTKGADNVILGLTSAEFLQKNKRYVKKLGKAVKSFAREGLRTLVMGKRKISNREFKRWHEEWINIKQSNSTDKEELLTQKALEIEKDFELVGASAIEDKLQDDVPETIEKLKTAGINIWVLTGDKLETAVEIGKSSRLIQGDCKHLIVHSTEDLENELNKLYETYNEFLYQRPKVSTKFRNDFMRLFKRNFTPQQLKSVQDLNKEKLNIRLSKTNKPKKSHSDQSHSYDSNKSHQILNKSPAYNPSMHTKYSDFQYYTLVLDGTTVSYILSSDSETKEKFFKLGYLAESCICCRLSPSQKADLVSLAHQFGNAITLSIGDGANDVNMIQTARIGVGISGKEGPQAAQASDFEIAQFRFLQQLLFIHGRYGYRRICTFICYYFYKNITLVFSEIWFAIVCGFSGQIFFLDWLPMLYNILWTSWPCMLGFAFYKDIKEEVCIEYPNIFGAGSCNAYFSFGIFWKWLIFAVIHGTMCFWYSILCFQEAFEGSAKDAGLWFISTVSFSTVIMLVNLKLMLELTHFSWKFV